MGNVITSLQHTLEEIQGQRLREEEQRQCKEVNDAVGASPRVEPPLQSCHNAVAKLNNWATKYNNDNNPSPSMQTTSIEYQG